MNKNKIIFSILGILIIIAIIYVFLMLTGNKATNTNKPTSNDFTIWLLQDDPTKFDTFLKGFKETNKTYKDAKINIVSFSNYAEYYNTLVGAFLNGKGPDLFVLNNNDSKLFDNQIVGIPNDIINPDDFRKNYDIVFSNDLIESADQDGKKSEYLRGIPMGYEVLGLFYNFRDLRGKKLKTWGYINDVVKELATPDKSVIGLGGGKTVYDSNDIITQFFVQDGFKNIEEVTGDNAKNSLGRYFIYADKNLENKYDVNNENLLATGKNDLDLFSAGDLQMVVGYPRMLEDIDKKGFNKNFLRVETFPSYKENSGKLLANYNYFVVSKDTKDYNLSMELLKYFSSESGQKNYLDNFAYYLPSMLSLISDRLEQNLRNDYVIKYKDFYNSSFDLVSFDKRNRVTYDKEMTDILDNSSKSQELFENFRKRILCVTSKMLKQENMGLSCN